MMIVEQAPAKINLALHVRARRADGYHDIETLFAFLRDGDELRLSAAPHDTLSIGGPFGAPLHGTGDNLVTRAQAAFRATFDGVGGSAVHLEKCLPIASGIGGGSADAAATLRGLARLYDVSPEDPRLMACAAALGADVPACLVGRSAFGSGKGDLLEPLDGTTGMPVLLVNPGVPLSTAAVFRGWDGVDRGPITDGTILARALAGRNDLEPPARALVPEIDAVLGVLAQGGAAVLTRMSGSGATCFALFRDAGACTQIATEIRAAQPGWWCLESTLA